MLPHVQTYHKSIKDVLGSSVSKKEEFTSMRNLHYGRSPSLSLRSRPTSPSPSVGCTRPPEGSCVYGRTSLTPPPGRRYNHNPSPAGSRRNWIQRHSRRPNTVNMDENTLAGKNIYYLWDETY